MTAGLVARALKPLEVGGEPYVPGPGYPTIGIAVGEAVLLSLTTLPPYRRFGGCCRLVGGRLSTSATVRGVLFEDQRLVLLLINTNASDRPYRCSRLLNGQFGFATLVTMPSIMPRMRALIGRRHRALTLPRLRHGCAGSK